MRHSIYGATKLGTSYRIRNGKSIDLWDSNDVGEIDIKIKSEKDIVFNPLNTNGTGCISSLKIKNNKHKIYAIYFYFEKNSFGYMNIVNHIDLAFGDFPDKNTGEMNIRSI